MVGEKRKISKILSRRGERKLILKIQQDYSKLKGLKRKLKQWNNWPFGNIVRNQYNELMCKLNELERKEEIQS